MIVCEFNSEGMEAFGKFLAAARQNPDLPVPRHLLSDPQFSIAIDPSIVVEPRIFVDKGDAAHYLSDVLTPLADHDVAERAGLWTWLSLFYFDEICPRKKGKRSVRNDYTYIFEPKNPRHFYRHLLFISWRVLKVAPHYNRLFLRNTVFSLDKYTSEVMKRLYLTRIPAVFEVLDRIYWDENRGKARPGMTEFDKVRPGNLVHRFPIRIRQLEKTFDLQSLSPDQLIDLLGTEFQHNGH